MTGLSAVARDRLQEVTIPQVRNFALAYPEKSSKVDPSVRTDARKAWRQNYYNVVTVARELGALEVGLSVICEIGVKRRAALTMSYLNSSGQVEQIFREEVIVPRRWKWKRNLMLEVPARRILYWLRRRGYLVREDELVLVGSTVFEFRDGRWYQYGSN